MNKKKTFAKIRLFLVVFAMIFLSGCLIKYTSFEYKIRGCAFDDENRITASKTGITIHEMQNFSKITFEKKENKIRIYFKERSECKMFLINIKNISKGDYELERYQKKYDDKAFFELYNQTTITVG